MKLIPTLLGWFPYIRGLHKQIRDLHEQVAKQGLFPAGHYYSPIPESQDVLAYIKSHRPNNSELADINLRKENQFLLLQEYYRFYDELPFPEKQGSDSRYYYDQDWFCYADAIFLYSFLRKNMPRKIVEVGSGFSSAVILDIVERFFSQQTKITFIDPYPDRLISIMKNHDKDNNQIITTKVQEVPIEIFKSLEAGDLLFIDSSHVLKCGSDVQLLLFDILPLLPTGVFVHFHDVFYPFEYPSEWLSQGRYWNEDYFLRAFLSYNIEWSIYFFNTYVAYAFKDFLEEKMPLCLKNTGGSLYIQKVKKG